MIHQDIKYRKQVDDMPNWQWNKTEKPNCDNSWDEWDHNFDGGSI